MPNHILFLAHSSEAIYQECAFALLSLTANVKEFTDKEVWIYTDNPSWFERFRGLDLPLRFRALSQAEIQRWRGPHDFVHRVKVNSLLEFTTQHPGNLLFLDTDVQLMEDITPLFQGITTGRQYMHVREGLLAESKSPILRKTARFFQAHRSTLFDGQKLPAPQEFIVWNSGVVGYRADDGSEMEAVLRWVDAVHPRYQRHITEQLGISIVLGNRGPIYNAAPYVLHYWSAKEVRPILASFFNHYQERDWQELVALSRMISLPVYMQEKTSFFINRSVAGKMAKAQWKPPIPNWEEEERLLA